MNKKFLLFLVIIFNLLYVTSCSDNKELTTLREKNLKLLNENEKLRNEIKAKESDINALQSKYELLKNELNKYRSNNNNNKGDLTTWDEEKLYSYLNEVKQYIKQLPVETSSKEKIIKQYELYFTPELSKKIVDSLYITKTDIGWKIPDGDGGYMFVVPNRESENSEVTIEFNHDYIRMKTTYKYWMYSSLEYVIRYQDKPVITGWNYE